MANRLDLLGTIGNDSRRRFSAQFPHLISCDECDKQENVGQNHYAMFKFHFSVLRLKLETIDLKLSVMAIIKDSLGFPSSTARFSRIEVPYSTTK